MSSPIFEFGPFRLDPDGKQLLFETQPLPLKATARKILTLLVQHQPHVVTIEKILGTIWPDTFVEDGNVTVNIWQIRRLLRKHDGKKKYILTVRNKNRQKKGYSFIVPVSQSLKPLETHTESASTPKGSSQTLTVTSRQRLAWRDFAQTITDSHLNRRVEEYPYALRPNAVPLRATIGERPEYHDDVVELVCRHLQPGTLNFIVGEYGAGKSYVSGRLAYRLAEKFLKETVGSERLPVILPLRQTTTLSKIDEFLESTLFTMYGVVFSPASFLAAHQSGRLVLILDGLDEMIARTDRKDIRYHLSYLTESIFFATTPIVITTRPNIIPSGSYYRSLGDKYHRFTLDPLDEQEVQKYFEALQMEDVWKLVNSGATSLMKDLVTRPLYIEMIQVTQEKIRTAPPSELTVRQLYDCYFNYWYERELQNQGRAPADLDEATVKKLLAYVAQLMTCAGKLYIGQSVLKSSVERVLEPATVSDAHTLFTAARERLILVPDFTEQEDEVRFTFRHDSLKSYFYALYLAECVVGELKDEHLSGIDSATVDFLFALAATNNKLSNRLTTMAADLAKTSTPTKKSVLAFLWHRKLGNVLEPAQVRWLCTGDEEVRTIVARNLAGVKFADGATFTDVNLSNANLSGASLSRATFEKGSLTDAVLTKADLSGTRFLGTNLNFTKFRSDTDDWATSDSTLSDAIFSHVQDGHKTDFTNVSASDVTIEDSKFVGALFIRARLAGLVAHDTDFIGVCFQGSELRNATFSRCHFEDCNFTKAFVEGATFDIHCTFIRSVV